MSASAGAGTLSREPSGGEDLEVGPLSGIGGRSGGPQFALVPALEAHEPPEARGLARDGVRLLVARGGRTVFEHRRFGDLPDVLESGDLVVVNTSATVPAAVTVRTEDGSPADLHFSGRLPGGVWVVEPRRREHRGDRGAASRPWIGVPPPTSFELPAGGHVVLHTPATAGLPAERARLWIASVKLPGEPLDYLARYGRPIRYSYVERDWPIDAYQTVFARHRGSAEMPSAARPFTTSLVTRLVTQGVIVAPLILHAGVASPEAHEPPLAEWYRVPATTASLVNATRDRGGRVVAVGTTVVRALETVTERDGTVHPGAGWTELVIGSDRPVRAVDGLITGWHEPGASHLAMLEAVGGPSLVAASYAEAVSEKYLWHEFGDSHLLLP
jgi:S-adenosylmethionine:tRNA ribosyltransferase-isomerase